MRLSGRSGVDPFIVMDVMEAARQHEAAGHSVVHMEVGQPGTGAPKQAVAALTQMMQTDPLGYTVALGLPELRTRISQHYRDWYDVLVPAERIIVTAGSSAAFLLAFTCLFDAGQRVAIGDPGYPSYRNILKALSLKPVSIETDMKSRFQPTPPQVLELDDLAGLLVASPANPTGSMLDKPALAALINACSARDIAFISDEIYHGITYDNRATTALEISDDVIVINSFSKYFSMTGWRIGWMVVPETHVRQIERLAQNMFICAPHASQLCALAALDCGPELRANLRVYRQNRALMLDGLPRAGFKSFAPPDGAFYVYADVSEFTEDSRALADEILHGAGVAVTPGLDFDPLRGAQTLRFSYARSTADIKEGLMRLQKYMQARAAR